MAVNVRRALQAVAVLVLAGLLGLFALSLRSDAGSVKSQVLDGEHPPAPEFALRPLSGEGEVRLSDHRGDVVLVNFWASWCEPCRDETPLLVRWADRYGPRGLTVVGVDAQDFVEDARRFAGEYGVRYPIGHDSDNSVTRRWGVSGFPETFVVDRAGRVRHTWTGPVEDEDLRETVLPLLEEPA